MGKVLVIAPHADDEVLGCGVAIQWHVREGDDVAVAILANRVINHVVDEQYVRTTKQMARDACTCLGVSEVFFGDLADENLDVRLIDTIVAIEKAITAYTPSVAYVPTNRDYNQDHRAVFEASRVALRFVDRVMAYEIVNSSHGFEPNVFIEAEQFIDTKLKALEVYGDEIREFPYPRSFRGVRVLSEYRGMQVYRKNAEAFQLIKQVVGGVGRGASG